MEEEPDESQQAPDGKMPLGVRLTQAFLGAVVFILVLPTAGAGFVGLFSVGAAVHEPQDALLAIGGAAAFLGGFCGLLAALLGANWLTLAVRAPHEDPARARWPHHPLRSIARPLLISGGVYAVFSSVAWLTVMIASEGKGSSWTWLCFWGALGIGCHFLIRMIDRYLETQ